MYFKMKLLLEQWNMFYKNMVYHSYKIILCFKKYYKFFPNVFTFFPTLDSHMCIEQSSLWAIHGRAPEVYIYINLGPTALLVMGLFLPSGVLGSL